MSTLMLITIIYSIYVLIKIYIDFMEIGFIKQNRDKKAVVLTPQNYVKAADYKVSSTKVGILSSFYDYFIFIAWIGFGLKFLDDVLVFESEALKAVVFVNAFMVINGILALPFELYSKFVLDKKYEFSNMTAKLFIIDTVKSLALTIVFGSLVVYAIHLIITTWSLWWLYSFIAVFAIIIFINAIYPTLIAPIFNKFKILENEDLKNSIETLLANAGLKTNGVFTIDASKRDNRLNAYFGGLGKSKRVVLFDTLIEKLSKNELLAVLGHELGHFKHKDILKNIAMMGGMMFIMLYIFGNLPQSFFSDLGLQSSSQVIMVLFLMLSSVIGFFLMPIVSAVSRHNEYAADEYGSSVQSKEDLANALMKLANENKSFPLSHKLTIVFYHSHPPLTQRLKALDVDL